MITMDIKFSDRTKLIKGSDVRNKLFDNPEIIKLAAGKPEESLFPVEELTLAVNEAMKYESSSALQYGSTEGFDSFREILASDRMKSVGVDAATNNITLTSGSQQAIDIAAKIFTNEGDTVICESPTYTGALGTFKPYNVNFVGVPMDDNGMIMKELEKALIDNANAKLIYTIPDFHNPTGRCMSDHRRKQLAELGAKYKVPIIEDNPYGELIYEGEKHPAVKSFDKDGWVVYLGTFSKILAPGFRLAWICASDEILNKFILAKQNSDLQTSTFSQRVVEAYMKKNDIDKHIDSMRVVYKGRRDAMLESIKKYFPKDVKHTVPYGGFFVWLELKENINTNELLLEAAKNAKVAFIPGSGFFPEEGYTNCIRLSYSHSEIDIIEEGIKRLGNLLHSYY